MQRGESPREEGAGWTVDLGGVPEDFTAGLEHHRSVLGACWTPPPLSRGKKWSWL